MISAKKLLRIGFVLVLQIAMILGGLLGSDVALAYDAQQRYNERYEDCMKTDDRGSRYCREWAGPSTSNYESNYERNYDRRPSSDMIDSKTAQFHECLEKSDYNPESCKKILFDDN